MTSDDDDHNDNEPTPPWLARIPLASGHESVALLIVHPGRAVAPPQDVVEVLRWWADGRGGWLGAARTASGLWGYLDGEGRWRVPPTLQNARSFSEDSVARLCDGGRWGFLDLSGAVVIAPAFDHAQPFRNGVCAVQVGPGAWRIIDRTGQPACGEVFHELSAFGAHGLARATLHRKDTGALAHGFVDRTGRWVIEPRFLDARPFGESPVTAATLDGELYGLIDARGRWVLEPSYPRIDAFNADGLAFFDEPNAWDNGHGYLDERGKVAVKGGRHLSPRMACGVAANSYDGTSYLMADGQALPTPPLSYGADFSAESCYAVVRTAAARTASTADPARWGVLHPDGRFVPAPEHLLEPLTDGDGWLVQQPPDTPLTPFLTRDGQLAFIDGEGAIAWRAHYDGQQVALLDATGAPLWRSGVRENCWPPGPFFNAPLSDHLENLASIDGIVPLALELLADAEARLHRLAAGDELAPDGPADGAVAVEGGGQEEDVDPGLVQAGRTVVARRVMRACLSEPHNGPYEFLCTDLNRAVDEARLTMVQQLTARFGTCDPHPEHAAPRHWRGEYTQAWPVALAKPLPGDSGTLQEAREQWLTLYKQSGSRDGDVWWELWLMAAPSIDALQSAERARTCEPAVAAPGPADRHDEAGSDGNAIGHAPAQWPDDAALTAQLASHPRTLADLPRERITHAMVEAALAADESAVRFVPKRLMTPARYAAALRHGVAEFDQIPAAMLSEEASIAHVRDHGWRLAQVPETLRTVEVCVCAVVDSPDALEHVPGPLRGEVEAAAMRLRQARQEQLPEGADRHAAAGRGHRPVGSWLARRMVASALHGQDNAVRRLQHKGVVAASVVQAAMTAPSTAAPTLAGLAGWLEHRPALAVLTNMLLGLAALAGHVFVSVAAWRAEGPWVGLLSFALIGLSDAYWAWRLAFQDPRQWGLALTAAAVVLYVVAWRRLYRRVGLALAARQARTPRP